MEQKNNKTYIYLARRDKKEIKILTSFPIARDNYPPTRIKDVKVMGLPDALSKDVEATVYKDRMLWEPFIECAENYEDLRRTLVKRGYKIVPMHYSPLHPLEIMPDKTLAPRVNIEKKKSMIRRRF